MVVVLGIEEPRYQVPGVQFRPNSDDRKPCALFSRCHALPDRQDAFATEAALCKDGNRDRSWLSLEEGVFWAKNFTFLELFSQDVNSPTAWFIPRIYLRMKRELLIDSSRTLGQETIRSIHKAVEMLQEYTQHTWPTYMGRAT